MHRIVLSAIVALFCAQGVAHTRLVDSLPSEGGVFDVGAGVVTLRFSEPIQPRFSDFSLHFLGAEAEAAATAGNRLPRLVPRVDGTRRRIDAPLPDSREPGWYALDWKVLAEDGHTIGGTLRFQVLP
jgi:copper resistance protein C